MSRWRRRLRTRVVASFAGGALALGVGIAGLTYASTRSFLIHQREASAVRQARANARLVRNVIRSDNPDVGRLLASLQTPASSRSLLFHDGRWSSTTLGADTDLIPQRLSRIVIAEHVAARQRVATPSGAAVIVGVPLESDDAYFEVFPFTDVTRALTILAWSLGGAALVMVAGATAVGVWGSGRVLRPLTDVGRTAATIAGGDLTARLDVGGDEDLLALALGFNSMVETLRERIERDARFASDVSHELRSPLTTLRSATQVMERRKDRLDERSRRALELLGDEVRRFERMVSDLLEISRFDAGVADLERDEVDVETLVRSSLRAEGADAPVERRGGRFAFVDNRRVERAVRNIARNARLYAGGVSRVLVSVGDDGGCTITIDDSGPGVPVAERDHIFERFARGAAGSERSSTDGSGLGLALVREHIALHGGTVHVTDAEGGGARFVIDLPGAARPPATPSLT